MKSLLEELKIGKTIKVKHPDYAFTIHALLKAEDGKREPTIKIEKINLPTKASRGEKLRVR